MNINIRPLFVMNLVVNPMLVIGETPSGFRRVGVVTGGAFEGDRISGRVLDGSNDWQLVRNDGSTLLDVRLNLKTKEEELLTMSYRGIRHGPADVMKDIEAGIDVDPSRYYFRISPFFETASKKYDWLNRVVAVGTGHRTPDGPVYSVFEVL